MIVVSLQRSTRQYLCLCVPRYNIAPSIKSFETFLEKEAIEQISQSSITISIMLASPAPIYGKKRNEEKHNIMLMLKQLTSFQLFRFLVEQPFCSIRPVEPKVVPEFPVTIPLYFDTAPICPEIYDESSGHWETSNLFIWCVDCFGPPESGVDAEVTAFHPDTQEVCYYHTCSSSDDTIPDILFSCCTAVSVTFPPCENAAVRCDFSTLTPGVPLADGNQAQKLRDACFMKAGGPRLNIFNSSAITSTAPKHDSDLGSPNHACGDKKGPGRGKGGKPWIKVNGTRVENPYNNCAPLGNLLIIQNENIATEEPNDSPNGGCMYFTFFGRAVSLNGIGLLDIEEGATISVSLMLLFFINFVLLDALR